MNGYLIFIIALLVGEFLLDTLVERLNLKRASAEIPEEFKGWYDPDKYATSQRYLRDTTRLDAWQSTIMTPLTIAFIVLGGFGYIDEVARSAGWGMIGTGLLFAGMLVVVSQLVALPFDIYSTFVIEDRYGFNKTTPRTFVTDRLKGLVLTALLGGLLFAALLWFFSRAGTWAWLYSWIAITAFQMVMMYIAPVVFLPMFNTFTPLEDGDLKERLNDVARRAGFSLDGIFTMDGSKRSTKSNAYFTGFGRWRRIALFDTLIEKHETDEIVSVLAHEIGHYTLRHIQKMLVISILSSGLMFYILSLFLTKEGLYSAFRVPMTTVDGSMPIYAGMVFFGFLYAPINTLLSVATNALSRKHEYEADAFAVATVGQAEAMITALKKLTVDTLSNLTPHPLKVFLAYSHPPILLRVAAIRKRQGESKL